MSIQYQKSAVNITDGRGHNVEVSAFGDMFQSTRKDVVNIVPVYDFRESEVVLVGSATNTIYDIYDGTLRLKSTGPASVAYESLTSIRAKSSQIVYAFGNICFVTGAPAGTYFYGIGIYDDEDGYAIGIKNGQFGVAHYRTDRTDRENPIVRAIDEFIPYDQFNVDKLDGTGPSKYDLVGSNDIDKMHAYMISFNTLSAEFKIKLKSGRWQTFHTINHDSSLIIGGVSVPYLPLRSEIDDPNGIGLEVRTASSVAGTIGGTGFDSQTRTQIYSKDLSTPQTISTSGTTIALFRMPENYQFIRTKIGSLLKTLTAQSDGAQGFNIRIEFNPSITVNGTWTQISSDGPVHVSEDTVVDIGTGRDSGLIFPVDKVDAIIFDSIIKTVETRLRRSQTAHIYAVANGGSGTLTSFSVTYDDEF